MNLQELEGLQSCVCLKISVLGLEPIFTKTQLNEKFINTLLSSS